MGKDIKVGLVIGIIVLLFLFGYWFNRSSSHPSPDVEKSAETASDDTTVLTIAREEGLKRLTEPESALEIEEQAPPLSGEAAQEQKPVWPTAKVETRPPAPVIEEKPTAAASTEEEGVRKYTVKKGDTLITISRKVYGDGSKWRLIRDANKVNPTRLQIGQVLIIPPLPGPSEQTVPEGRTPEEVPALPESATVKIEAPDIRAAARIHKVAKGDTLYAIARRYYKDGSRWRTIARANGISDYGSLKVGQRLRIP